jgi:hypothetical protein
LKVGASFINKVTPIVLYVRRRNAADHLVTAVEQAFQRRLTFIHGTLALQPMVQAAVKRKYTSARTYKKRKHMHAPVIARG